MKVLLVGSGGREHTLAWKLSRSPLLTRLYAAPGNPGIAAYAELLPLTPGFHRGDHAQFVEDCARLGIDFVVVGPEAPLVAGLADDLMAAGIAVFGPSRAAARLEGSKAFTKALCRTHNIPTADYETFSDHAKAIEYARSRGAPLVVKADGLAAGKGVRICPTLAEAEAAISDCFAGVYGDAGRQVIVEEMLEGEEASFFAICDGEHAIAFGTAQDHKRAYDGDTGPNTGGMGAYSPAPVMSAQMIDRTMVEIVQPTLRAMADMGAPFRGVLFAGLMVGESGPKLIEYNVRFGDPECQSLMLRLNSDILPVLLAAAQGDLSSVRPEWSNEHALTVVLASQGYPGKVTPGSVIAGLAEAEKVPGVIVFHAGTALSETGALIATGGRVLNVSAVGSTLSLARERAYEAVRCINWPGSFYRSDIGARALSGEKAA
jgi:phosphoribosylamine--glycine ligase